MVAGVLGSSRTEGAYFVNFLATWLLWNVYVRRIRGRNVTRRHANHNLFFSSSWRHRFLLLQLRDAGTADASIARTLSPVKTLADSAGELCILRPRLVQRTRIFYGRPRKVEKWYFRVSSLHSLFFPFKRTRYFRREDDFLFRILLYRSISLERPCVHSNWLSVCSVTYVTYVSVRVPFRCNLTYKSVCLSILRETRRNLPRPVDQRRYVFQITRLHGGRIRGRMEALPVTLRRL